MRVRHLALFSDKPHGMNAVHQFDSDDSAKSWLSSARWHRRCEGWSERTMDYIKPNEVVSNMIKAGEAKAALGPKDLLIRGILSGGLLGIATSLAITGAVQTSLPLVGALIFPVGFVIIVLLGLELVTGSFALVPLALKEGKINIATLFSNLSWVFLGNLIGSV